MKKLVTTVALAATVSLATLVAAGSASAAPQRNHQPSVESSVQGQGYYEGDRELRIDSRDRASSPYAGGV